MNSMKSRFLLAIALSAVGLVIMQTYLRPLDGPVDAATEGSGTKSDRAHATNDVVTVRTITEDGTLSEATPMAAVKLSDAAWKERLTDKQLYILRNKGTERSGTGKLLKVKEKGIYTCAGCKLPLFSSDTKFESGTGWPSFYTPIAKENVLEESDDTLGMVRTEVLCARCDGHLGHVFNDGPQPTGLRYCMNSEAMEFTEEANIKALAEEVVVAALSETPANSSPWLPFPTEDTPKATESGEAKAIFGGGCFWCTEANFEMVEGVKSVVSGYAGGDAKGANYKAVCTGTTGHAEVIEITYDPSVVTYGELMRVFFTVHDPTTLNYQKPDAGTQYRSAIFYQSDAEKALAAAYITQLNSSGKFTDPIVTTLEALEKFYPAEDYHQDFKQKNPNHAYLQRWAIPKLEKLSEMLKADKEKT